MREVSRRVRAQRQVALEPQSRKIAFAMARVWKQRAAEQRAASRSRETSTDSAQLRGRTERPSTLGSLRMTSSSGELGVESTSVLHELPGHTAANKDQRAFVFEKQAKSLSRPHLGRRPGKCVQLWLAPVGFVLKFLMQ